MHEDDENLLARLIPPQKPTRSIEEIARGESDIVKSLKDVRYVVREYPIEVLVAKYLSGLP